MSFRLRMLAITLEAVFLLRHHLAPVYRNTTVQIMITAMKMDRIRSERVTVDSVIRKAIAKDRKATANVRS